LKILYYLRKAEKSETILSNIIKQKVLKIESKKINYSLTASLCKYVRNFYKKYAKKNYTYIKTFFYYKQLVYINKTKYSYTFLKYLKDSLEKLYNKNVEFNLVNVKRFYVNSDILSEAITLKLTKKRRKISRYLKNIKKKVKIIKKKILFVKPVARVQETLNIEKKDLFTLKKVIFSDLKYKNVTGFRLEARGRLTRRYTASRSVTKFKYKGNLLNIDSSYKRLSTILLKGNLRSNLQFTKLKSKTRIGSFGIKG